MNWNVLYANKKSYDILEFMEPNLHKWNARWHSFHARDIIGKSLEWLFTDEPEEFRKASDPRNHPYRKNIRTGPCTCDVIVRGTTDANGNVDGYAVYWERITEKIEQEHRVKQLMQVLEESASNTLLCDTNWNVLYANKKSFEILDFMEPNLHKHNSRWHSFHARDIVGKSLEWLFTDEPEEFHRASDPRNHPYRKNIKTGPCTCDVIVTSTKDDDGKVDGYAVYWERITEKLAQERRVQQLMQVLEESSANTILCDLNWNVLFANKKTFDILRFMEPNLHKWDARWNSFRANDIVGKSLEWLFTDEPEEFRKASDARNHPYRKNVRTGPCTCDIMVNSTTNDDGSLSGYAIYWERITDRLAMEAKIQEQVREGEYLAEKISEMKGVTMAIAGGDLTQKVQIEKQDLVGELGAAFNDMTVALMDVAQAANSIAAGNLAVNVKPQSDKDILGNAFDKMIKNLSQLVAQTRGATDNIEKAAGEVASGNEDLSQRTSEQASSLEETASSMEEMTATVKQNADSSRQANQLASQAREVAEKGGQVVSKAVQSMEEINKASKRIADIISVIDEIAFQTNLLALNAAVEAARVGEQGRGFAVVAAEVRNLAGRSSTAAKEIKALVQDTVGKVQEGSDLVNQSGQQLDEIVSSVKKVADIIQEISAASQEQSAGIEQVNRAIMQMDQITQQNASLVEEASAASQSMTQQARGLQELVGRFKLDESYAAAIIQSTAVAQHAAQRPAREEAATGTYGRSNGNGSNGWQRPAAKTPLKLSVKNDSSGEFEEF